VNHPVGADESLFPGFRGDETAVEEEGDRLGDEIVEVLDSDLGEPVFIHRDGDGVAVLSVASQGCQPVTEAALSGKVTVLEAKPTSIVGVAWMVEVSQELGSRPAVDDAPADQEEDGNGIKGNLSPGRGPTKALRQHVAQGAEIDQAEQEIEVGEMHPSCRIVQILPAPIDVMGPVGPLGRGRHVVGDRPQKG
jgi:hypothetical protein